MTAAPKSAEGHVEWYVIRRHGAFFRPDAAGYTTHISAAGFYTREEADRYADVEGVTIGRLSDWRAEADAVIKGAARLTAALAAQTPAAVEGWKLVPVELSQDMLEAVVKLDFTATHDPLWPEYWSAMLSASPPPPSVGVEDGYAHVREAHEPFDLAIRPDVPDDHLMDAIAHTAGDYRRLSAAIRLLGEGEGK